MKAPASPSFGKQPRHATRKPSLRMVVLAWVLLLLQPLHWVACCVPSLSAHPSPSGLSGTPGVSFASAETSAASWSSGTPSTCGARKTFVSAQSGHHHVPCCTNCDVSLLTAQSPRSAPDSVVVASVEAGPAVPVFRLDVLAGRFGRAGPPPAVTPLLSVQLASALRGRAPPVSA